MATENWTSAKDIKARIKELETKYKMKLGNNQGREWDVYRNKNLKPHDSGVGGVDKLTGGRYRTRGDEGWLKIQSDFQAAGQEVAQLKQSLKNIKRNDKNLKAAQYRLKLDEIATPRKDDPSTPQNEANFGTLLHKGRALLSRKTVSGKNKFLLQRENYLKQQRAEIERLKIGTSGDTGISDYAAAKASAKEWNTPFTNQYGVTTTHSDQHKLKIQNQQAGKENPNLFKGQMLISQGGGNTAILQPGSPGSNLNKDTVSNQGTDKNDFVGTPNSNTLKVNSAIPEAPIVNETENRKLLKSDVFTLDENNKPLGVMTNAQRRKWDAANQELMRKNQLKIGDRTYSSGDIGTGSG